MKKTKILKYLVPIGIVMIAGCVDDKYDLEDIDTTTEVKFNDLMIPVNLNSIYLEKVFDIDENDPNSAIQIIEGENGNKYYAINKGGSFESDPLFISEIKAPKPVLSTTELSGIISSISETDGMARMSLPSMITPFEYFIGKEENSKVDNSITGIRSLSISNDAPLIITFLFTIDDSTTTIGVNDIALENLRLKFPIGYDVSYYGSNAIYTTDEKGLITLNADSGKIQLYVSRINFNGIYVQEGAFNFSGSIEILGGDILMKDHNINGDVGIKVNLDMTGFNVNSFSGSINYYIKMPELDPIDLTDIPDFLTDSQTNIVLENPQISLSIINPLSEYGLNCNTGFSIYPERNDILGTPLSLSRIEIKGNKKDYQNFVVAPKENYYKLPDYPNPEYISFPALRNVIAGDGVPSKLQIQLKSDLFANPNIAGSVNNFPLGKNLPTDLKGNYSFFTPLALASNSTVVYAKEVTGWYKGIVEKMKINKLRVKALAYTDLPCNVKLEVQPMILVNGNPRRMPGVISSSQITANAKGQEINFEFDTVIENLDGIYYNATVSRFSGDEGLSPDQQIRLEDIRITVDGVYTTDF